MAKDTRTYWEKLKDPRWQKKRLEILERAGWKCECCGSTDQTLHVHHGYYKKGADPWEYAEETLHCLCPECHEYNQGCLNDIHALIGTLHEVQIGTLWEFALDMIRHWPCRWYNGRLWHQPEYGHCTTGGQVFPNEP